MPESAPKSPGPVFRSFRLVCEPGQVRAVEALLAAEGHVFEPEPFSPLCRRLLAEPSPLGSSLAARFGLIYIQDRSSMLPPLALVRAAEAGPGSHAARTVLDLCASPGSKTGFLAQLVGKDGFVLGNEPNHARLATLRANLHALGLVNAATCSYPGEEVPLPPNSLPLIQLDPPCSGWGTENKNPGVREIWQGDKIDSLVSLQQRLLRHAASLLAPGGLMVYSTCTTNEAENEAQVSFAEDRLGLVRQSLEPFPGFVWDERPGGAGTLRVDGQASQAQGFYLALLRKPGGAGGHTAEGDEGLLPVSAPASDRDRQPDHAGKRFKKGGKTGASNAGSSGSWTLVERQALAGPGVDPELLPPGQAVIFASRQNCHQSNKRSGKRVRDQGQTGRTGQAGISGELRFVPDAGAGIIGGIGGQLVSPAARSDWWQRSGLRWQAALLGKWSGGRFLPAPRLRCLLPSKPDPKTSLVLEDVADLHAMVSGQSRQTGLANGLAGLWWRDLSLGYVAIRQGRAVALF